MKEFLTVFLLFFNLVNLFPFSPGDKFSSSSDWSGQDGNGNTVISGQVNTTVTIVAASSDSLAIHIFKEMTPFGQFLDFDTTALMKNGRYEFREIDNRKNSAFGYIKDNGDSIDFFLDCAEFDEDGKNLGRLYGDRYVLPRDHG